MHEDIKGKFQWSVQFKEWTSFMQNSYQIYRTISNIFFVDVLPEKETYFTVTPQKIKNMQK